MTQLRDKLAVVALLCVCSAVVRAQNTNTSTIYRLTPDSSFVQGCFPPCLCPLWLAQEVRGTFKLTQTGVDPLYTYYAVTDVNWFVSFGDSQLHATGSGTYKIGGEFALVEQLELDLRINNGDVKHFDSGLVPAGGGFPETFDATISMNNMVCFDMVFSIEAQAVPPDEIQPYHLIADSTYQEGCFLFCDCVLYPEWPLEGTFALVPLSNNGLFAEFSVVNVAWHYTEPLPAGEQDVPVNGVGLYRVGGEVAAMHEMTMDLTVGSDPPQRFHSNLVGGGANFPAIDIVMTINDFVCYDQVITLHAIPAALVDIESANPPRDNPYLAGLQPFRDVLQTGTSNTLSQGIGGQGTPDEDEVTYSFIRVTFSGPTELTADDITVACSYTGNPPGSTPCPTVTGVQATALGEWAITLSGPIPPGGCTSLTFANTTPGQQLRYQYLPGDVTMNGVANTQDLLYMINALNNGDALQPANFPRLDINRSPDGSVNTQDLLRLIQLLNGTLTTQPWNGFQLVPCPDGTP